jgi:hypothetical protein
MRMQAAEPVDMLNGYAAMSIQEGRPRLRWRWRGLLWIRAEIKTARKTVAVATGSNASSSSRSPPQRQHPPSSCHVHGQTAQAAAAFRRLCHCVRRLFSRFLAFCLFGQVPLLRAAHPRYRAKLSSSTVMLGLSSNRGFTPAFYSKQAALSRTCTTMFFCSV